MKLGWMAYRTGFARRPLRAITRVLPLPSALGGDFTLVSSAADDKQPDGGIAASVHDSPKDDDNESKLEPSLLDQNSPLSELSPLPSHNNSIDMDQENENDDPDGGIPSSSKAKAKSRDTSPLSPASSFSDVKDTFADRFGFKNWLCQRYCWSIFHASGNSPSSIGRIVFECGHVSDKQKSRG